MMLVVLAGLLGCALGSFANVVIYRVPQGLSIVRPPSACPNCKHPIRPWHNLPVLGYVLLRGQCADCSRPISVRYPAVELTLGLAFAAVTWWQGISFATLMLLIFAFSTVVLGLIDLDVQKLPNRITGPLFVVLAAVVVVAGVVDSESAAIRAGLGALALGLFYLVVFVIYPRGMGGGDVKLAPTIGLVTAFFSWSSFLVGAFAAFLGGGLAAAVVLAQKKSSKRGIPFGPWMLLGGWCGIIWGPTIANWYLELAGIS